MSKKLFALSALAVLLVGCASARMVSMQPAKGGVIAVLPSGSVEARQKATVMMQNNCGSKKVEITEEGEAVIGHTSTGSANTSLTGHLLGTNTNSDTTQKTEWRITYKCI